jgi:hypothetical protein
MLGSEKDLIVSPAARSHCGGEFGEGKKKRSGDL